jgi:site-specific DNA-adenine methylase
MIHDLFGNAYVTQTEPLGIPYMGSKRKYADALITRMLELQPNARYFYDLFGGGGAMSFAAMQKGMTVHYNEKQTDMVDFMRFIFERMALPRSQYGLFPDEFYQFVTREQFIKLKHESGVYAQFVRICYSFGNNQKSYLFNPDLEKLKHLLHNVVMFRCAESLAKLNDALGVPLSVSDKPHWNDRRLRLGVEIKRAGKRLELEQLQQLERLQQLQQLEPNITFSNLDYRDVVITTPIAETIVYLDPPYRETAKYIEGLNHDNLDAYFQALPYMAFMSEYTTPFVCVNEIQTRSTLSSTRNACKKVERLYVNTPPE